MKTAKILLPIALNKEFDYSIPLNLPAKIGMRVLVNFNGTKRLGIITGIKNRSSFPNLKPILELLDDVPTLRPQHFEFAKNLSKIYPYNPSEFIFLMLPPHLRQARRIKTMVYPEKPSDTPAKKPVFIRAASFAKRYQAWKNLVSEALEHGSTLVCFPQISYLQEACKLIMPDFGKYARVMHSREKNLAAAWENSRGNSLILGVRSSFFYYPDDLRLIVIDEENSPYYFSEEKPFYHLPEAARQLAKFRNADLILSADYPALNTYKMIKAGEIAVQDMEKEENAVRVVDVSGQKRKIIGPVLSELLRRSVSENKSSVIILNRSGYASVVSCLSCGHTLLCERCSVFMHASLDKKNVFCTYCGKKYGLPQKCEKCRTGSLKTGGLGIEKVGSIIKTIFPETKIDPWENRKPDSRIILATSKILSSLYGTEKFHGGFLLDFDFVLSAPDYDASFNAFLYLKKLSYFFTNGLHVFTRTSQHSLFKYLTSNWKDFYDNELKSRRDFNLPPYGAITRITLRAKNENILLLKAQYLYNKLKAKNSDVFGPFKEHPFRLRGNYRYFIIARSKSKNAARKTMRDDIASLRTGQIKIAIQVK